jgi:hypothetical protein
VLLVHSLMPCFRFDDLAFHIDLLTNSQFTTTWTQ